MNDKKLRVPTAVLKRIEEKLKSLSKQFEFGKHSEVRINKLDVESSISVNPYLGKTKRTKKK